MSSKNGKRIMSEPKYFHVMPESDVKKHIESPTCWCMPKRIFSDHIASGNEVYQHNKFLPNNAKVMDFKEKCTQCSREIPEGTIVYRHPKLGFTCEFCPAFNDGTIKISDEEKE